MNSKKILIVVTNHTDFEHEKAEPTGLWFSELSHFYDVFDEAGVQMDIVSPKGGKIQIDGRSLKWPVFNKAAKKRHEDPKFMALLENTKSIKGADWMKYDAIFFAGGHGAMWDFADNDEIKKITREMYEGGKVVATVCHGAAALQNVKLSNGEFLIEGKKGTGFAYFDETIGGVKKIVPYNLESRLKERGMKYSKAFIPLAGHTVADDNLITGQNPNSATKTAQKTLEAIGARNDRSEESGNV